MAEIPSNIGVEFAELNDFTASERAAFEKSLIAVVNALAGTKKNGSNMAGIKMSEDVLYAALVYHRLKDEAPKAANGFLSELGTRFKRRIERADTQPLAKALKDTMQTAIDEKSITAKKAAAIQAEAFATAQLDKSGGALSRTAKKGGADAFEDRASTNSQNITEKNIARFEKFTAKLDTPTFLTTSQAKRQTNQFNQIVNSFDAKEAESTGTGSTGGSSPSTGSTKKATNEDGTPETDKAIPQPTVLAVETAPNDMVYKPDSLKNDKPLLMLPARYADRVYFVQVANERNELLETINEFSRGEDGRLYVRLKIKSTELGQNPWMKVHLKDSSSFDVFLNNGSEGLVERM